MNWLNCVKTQKKIMLNEPLTSADAKACKKSVVNPKCNYRARAI